jgi:hypothetical protein
MVKARQERGLPAEGRRLRLVGVAYAEQLDRIVAVLLATAATHPMDHRPRTSPEFGDELTSRPEIDRVSHA